MRKIYLSVVLLFLLTSVVGAAFPSELDKKVKKRVVKLFSPGPVFTEIPVAGAVTGSEALYKEGDQLWAINSSGGVLGYVVSTRAKGRYDYFDYSVIFTKDLSVMSVMVTTYRSSHGAGICSKGWLNQFSGYRGEEMRLGKEVDSISGATISATSIVEDIRRCYLVMDKLRSSGGL